MKIVVVGLWHLETITSLGLSNLGHQISDSMLKQKNNR